MSEQELGNSDVRDRAWRYLQNADNISSGRINFFLVAESMLILSFMTLKPDRVYLRLLVIALGLIYTLAWFYLLLRLSKRMDMLYTRYLRQLDPVYKEYIEAAPNRELAKVVVYYLLPLSTAAFWLLLIVETLRP